MLLNIPIWFLRDRKPQKTVAQRLCDWIASFFDYVILFDSGALQVFWDLDDFIWILFQAKIVNFVDVLPTLIVLFNKIMVKL